MAEIPFKLTARQAVRIVAEFVAFSILVALGIEGISWLGHRLAGTPDVSIALQELIAGLLGFVWVIRRAQRRHRVSWSQLAAWQVRPAGLFAPFLLLIFGANIALSGVDNAVETLMPSPDWLRELMREVMNLSAHPFASFATTVLMAPFVEEAICRGFVLRGLLGAVRPWRAIVISSTLFAVMHLNPWQMPGAFVGGLILGWAYWRTRSLGLCVAGHAFFNAIGLFAGVLPVEIPGFNTLLLPGQDAPLQLWWFSLGGLGVFIVGVAWFHRSAPPARPFPILPPSESPAPTDVNRSSTTLFS